MSTITIQEVTTEFVKKGKAGYNVANVVYDDNGKNYTKKIMSFANPAVFDAVKNAKVGETYEVKVVKEGEYYNWASLTPVAGRSGSQEAKPGSGKVVGSNYETAEERKLKQLYIIKQSSISNAIEYAKYASKEGVEDYTPGDILDLAQQFVDFVYGVNENLEKVDADIPY